MSGKTFIDTNVLIYAHDTDQVRRTKLQKRFPVTFGASERGS